MEIIAQVIMLFSAFSLSVGIFLQRYFLSTNLLSRSLLMNLTGVMVTFPIVGLFSDFSSHVFEVKSVVSIAYLGVMVNVIALILMFFIVGRNGDRFFSLQFYFQPFVAMVEGVVFFGEPVYLTDIIGGVLILTGLYFINKEYLYRVASNHDFSFFLFGF